MDLSDRAGPGCLNRISASISGASAGLGCQAEGQRGEVGLIGCRAVKARMWAPAVVEVEVTADRSARFAHAVVGSQIDLLVFDAAPQPLDEDVVPPSALAVHADGDRVLDQHTSESCSSELAALIRVEDVGLAVMRESVLQRLDAERRLHSCGLAPASWCADGDRAPLSPCAASASSRDGGRSCTPRRPAGLATSANRRKETPDAVGRDVASP